MYISHFLLHAIPTLLLVIVLASLVQTTVLQSVLLIIGATVIDLDTVFWYYKRRKRFGNVKSFLVWMEKDLNHKKVFPLYLHNFIFLILVCLFMFLVKELHVRFFLLGIVVHLVIDVIDDIVFINTVKHWVFMR